MMKQELVKGFSDLTVDENGLGIMERLYFIDGDKVFQTELMKRTNYFDKIGRKWSESEETVESVKRFDFIGNYEKPIK